MYESTAAWHGGRDTVGLPAYGNHARLTTKLHVCDAAVARACTCHKHLKATVRYATSYNCNERLRIAHYKHPPATRTSSFIIEDPTLQHAASKFAFKPGNGTPCDGTPSGVSTHLQANVPAISSPAAKLVHSRSSRTSPVQQPRDWSASVHQPCGLICKHLSWGPYRESSCMAPNVPALAFAWVYGLRDRSVTFGQDATSAFAAAGLRGRQPSSARVRVGGGGRAVPAPCGGASASKMASLQ